MYFDFLPGDLIGGDNIFDPSDIWRLATMCKAFYVVHILSCCFLADVDHADKRFSESLADALVFDSYDDAASVICSLGLSECHVFIG